MALLALILFGASMVRTAMHFRTSINDGLDREIDALSALVPETLSGPMFDFAHDRIEELSRSIFANESVVGVRVLESSEPIVELVEDGLDEAFLVRVERTITALNAWDEEIELGTVELVFSRAGIQQEIYAAVRDSVVQNVLILVALVVLNTIMLVRIVTRPIKQTSRKMQEIAEGESDLTNRINVTSNDEVGQLATYFNVFLRNLEKLIEEIRAGMDADLKIQGDLAQNTDETVSALAEMTAGIESTKQQVKNLSSVIESSGTTVAEIIGQNERTLKNVEIQGAMVSQTTSSVTQLLAAIESVSGITRRESASAENLVRIARTGGERLKLTSNEIAGIEKNIDSIRDLLRLINDIAAQTNLLAMNAAIEAAHAGESGKGFSVVAQEIRKLAESTGTNAKTISTVLEETIKRIQEASGLSRETTESFEEIDNAIGQTSSSFDEIAAAMNQMNSGSQEIHDAVAKLNDVSQELVQDGHRMHEGSSQLTVAIEQIGDVSRSVDSAMTEITSGTIEINNAMDHISRLTDDLGNTARDLSARISRFKTSKEQSVAVTPTSPGIHGTGGKPQDRT